MTLAEGTVLYRCCTLLVWLLYIMYSNILSQSQVYSYNIFKVFLILTKPEITDVSTSKVTAYGALVIFGVHL